MKYKKGVAVIALKVAWKICVVGWYVVPIYLVDIIVALIAFGISLMWFLFVPVLFVWINYHQICKNHDAAEKYLSYCKVPDATE